MVVGSKSYKPCATTSSYRLQPQAFDPPFRRSDDLRVRLDPFGRLPTFAQNRRQSQQETLADPKSEDWRVYNSSESILIRILMILPALIARRLWGALSPAPHPTFLDFVCPVVSRSERRLVELRILFFHSIWKLSRRRRFSSDPLEPIAETAFEDLRASIQESKGRLVSL
ncbi:BQ2448_6632 [Microbotryum intermedium]|uniref:BQ2448_6632 protein n=1 Tax=Microbotryum intermedium TaxID=269621 RepID=A0A238FK77_9BASI|nr:BQ2448_6632 [Microbotryum intermedium]